MMKKKLYNIFMLLVGVVSFAACTPEVDDAFDQSAAERVEMKMKECREVLTSAPNDASRAATSRLCTTRARSSSSSRCIPT